MKRPGGSPRPFRYLFAARRRIIRSKRTGSAMDISNALSVDDQLRAFVETELLAGSGVKPADFWAALERILADFMPANSALLARRDDLQAKIDAYWRDRR